MQPQRSDDSAESPSAPALWAEGLALHQAGRLDEARGRYEAALAVDPRHFDSLHLLGVICIQTGQLERGAALIVQALAINPNVAAAHGNLGHALSGLGLYQEAVNSCDRAIALQPDHAEAHGNRGQALYQLGRYVDALASYDRLIALKPTHARAHYNRGVMLRALGRLDEALDSFDRAALLKPDYADAWCNLGVTAQDLGRPEDALLCYDRAIAVRPDYAEAYYNRGSTLRDLRRPLRALDSYDRAIALRPDYAEAHSNRANVLTDLKRYEEALAGYARAVAIKPDLAEAWSNQMVPLRELRRPEEALACCDRAVALRSDYAEAYNNRAGALYEFRRMDEVLACFDQAIALKPDYAEAHDNRGVVLLEMRRLPEALKDFERAVALKPHYPEAHYNLAMGRLMTGDFAGGWAEYEWRWGTRQFEEAVRAFEAPLWLGREDIRGRTILLHGEQGLGDTLQFCRYVPQVAALGAVVILEVQAGLERLMDRLEGVALVITRGAPLPPHDFQTPLVSLPLALGAGPESGPYLSADARQAAAWAERLPQDGRLRVGLCWAGGARPDQPIAHAIDKRRSLPLEAFAPLAEASGVAFYSLQKGGPAAQLAELEARGWAGPPIVDLTAELTDFSDTAALVANLDLVISCDTSTAHLAGGLGRPVWVLNRFDACWRWLADRDDSPWYPTARLFRQAAPGAWDGVIEAVKTELANLHNR